MTDRSPIHRFLAELRRRHVPQTVAVYLVAAWAAIQFADVVVPNLNGPQWIITAVIVAAGVGLPVALVLAWIFDWGPDGVHRTDDRPGAPPESPESLGPGVGTHAESPSAAAGAAASTGGTTRSSTAPWLLAVAVLVVGIGSALAVAALLAGGSDDGDPGLGPPAVPGPLGRHLELAPRGGLVDPESIRSAVARDMEQFRELGELNQIEGFRGLARLGDLDSVELDGLLEVVAEAADADGMTVFLQEPAAWRLGRRESITLAAGDSLVVSGLARDTAGVESVSVDGSVVARAEDPGPNLWFTASIPGDRRSGTRQVAILVRTTDGREIRREYPVRHVPPPHR